MLDVARRNNTQPDERKVEPGIKSGAEVAEKPSISIESAKRFSALLLPSSPPILPDHNG